MIAQEWTAVWTILLTIADAKLSCRFIDNTQMFQTCNTTDFDNTLNRGIVSDKRETFHIILNRCQISSVNVKAFYGLPALAILDLSENKIQSLQLGVFNAATSLSRLNLSYNLLTELPIGIFNNNQQLSVLDLEGNDLKTLEPGIFDSVPRLYQLDLSYNSFTGKELVPGLIDRNHISIITLSGNNMIEATFLSTMNDLNYLFMNQCDLREVPKFATGANMRGLRHLSLSTNKISAINDGTIFNNLINVEVMNLTKNEIESIEENAFKGLKSLEVLDLRYNKLKTIPVEMFQNIRLLRDLRLSHNLLRTVQLNAFAGTALKRLEIDYNHITHLPENFLLDMYEFGVLKFLNFESNPWQCACLKQLLQEVKAMQVSYKSDNYDGTHPICVTTQEFICKRDETVNDKFINMYNNIIQ